ncbi:hypothetical protein WICANDRAFT_28445 [Wickerhamomyces anomalus NRRL Y-366-8]|uniref:RNA helicase n=1 Tax=Wickerhamomyces anomalus (strain ATCC 58044 / CBS 1984 / NCYC 433 / NRRL Y-366-8) TaxID=683960 RepID=A0A1E3P811_WICAA|nr:uncharacterized protein WICANDRAFT_28445 [Wickerhamomyces anomalus NRRL Y-366-8]ODQ61508.1 hypothetical protein WICANDRAFT_28445 [Wickerhamomyces anomalus NRRL Y-366-8]
MGQYRKRFNEKARQGMLMKQEKLRRVRQKQFTRHLDDGTQAKEEPKEEETNNPNAEILQPMTKAEREDRKRKLEEQIRPKAESKVSRNKKKRLDKYIEHQLKREEKQVLIQKLQESKFDTSLLKSSKLLGTGKQTKKEEFAEALELERQGRGDERTKEILYEEREVRDWDEDFKDENPIKSLDQLEEEDDNDSASGSDDGEKFGDSTETKSSFIDFRPSKFGGSGSGFSFQNLPKVTKTKKKSYNWRSKLAAEERRKNKIEDENDFESSEEEDDQEDEDDSQEEQEIDDEENENEEEDEEEGEDEEGESSGEEDDDEDDDESEEEEEEEHRKKFSHSLKAEAFKEWADEQIRKLEGREAPSAPTLPDVHYERVDRPEDLEDDLPKEYIPIDENSKRQAFYVNVNRSDEIQQSRMQLPVFGEEHRIMEAIHHNDVVIVCGETGSGKTTQVPQFLYEAGYGSPESPDTPGMIAITQPRRVAAISMAERVSNELGDHGDKVGYQIRFDSTAKQDTRMKFMTDGVLLREMMTDFILNRYSAITIDEAHERSINTDILIGMLSRVVKLRAQLNAQDPVKFKKLKLIIMSATLRVTDFSENSVLFDVPPPILKVEARQYPVSVHFNRRTKHDYLDEVFRKTCKIHQKLPPGGILIFLTGQNEITNVVKRLRKEFPLKDKKKNLVHEEEVADVRINSKHADIEAEEVDFSVKVNADEAFDDGADEDEDDDEEEGFEETLEEGQTDQDPLYVLPLYSLLPTNEQMKVFKEPPAGSRLCIVATNIAETSLTIPGIRYVVDAGRSKDRCYDDKTGVQSFEIDWVSKASADQRAGRAGRTGPGHCYRLYSSAVYERDFPQFSRPEILRTPIETVVLSMKSMGIDNVVNFPFPTPPERVALGKAEKLLQYLGALSKENKITDVGRTMSYFPISPRFAKMLLVGNQLNCLPYIVAIVSALSVGDPFINENELGIVEEQNKNEDEEEELSPIELEAKRKLRSKFHSSRQIFCQLDKFSDALKLLSAVCALDHVPLAKRDEFLRNHFLRPKLMEEISKLRKQVMYLVKTYTTKENIATSVKESEMKLGRPDKRQVQAIKQMISAGFVDQVAIRADLIESDVKITNRTNIINIPYITLFPTKGSEEDDSPYVYIHPTSILCNIGDVPPSYLIYQSVNKGANNNPESKTPPKTRLRALTDISDSALTSVAKNSGLITYSKPLGHPYAPKNITSTKRECWVVSRIGAAIGAGGVGLDLKTIKVIQNKVAGQWVNE